MKVFPEPPLLLQNTVEVMAGIPGRRCCRHASLKRNHSQARALGLDPPRSHAPDVPALDPPRSKHWYVFSTV